MADEEGEGEESEAPPPPENDDDDDDDEDDGLDITIYRNLYSTKILPPWDESKPTRPSQVTKKYRKPRDYTIALSDDNADEFGDITHVGWKGRVDYAIERLREGEQKAQAAAGDIYRDSNHLLEICISTVILMAAGVEEIPKENFIYTKMYLKKIRNDNGDHPPNISDLLKYMRYLKSKLDLQWDEFVTEPPPELQVTKIPKASRIPRRINRSTIANSTSVNADETSSPPEQLESTRIDADDEGGGEDAE